MKNEKVFIIGDVHGCLGMLQRLMKKINWRPERDRLIFLGDYIDRGKDSKDVVDYIIRLTKASSRVEAILGNHEALFLDYLDDRDRGLFLVNGGMSTLESYQAGKEKSDGSLVPAEHISFYNALKTYIELDEYFVVHAGFKPGIPIEKQSIHDMVWIRETFIHSDYDFGKRIIFGHTPYKEPLIMDNKIGLDTGAVYGNKLTCLELPGLHFHQIKA